jgi:8-oxo-dGTP diphosphatase
MPASHKHIVAVAALIFREGKVLAMRRAMTKDAAPGLWETLSGRVNPGEEPLDAALREIQEECGLTVRLDPRPVTAYTAMRLDDDMVLVVYRADWLAGEVVRSDEHDDHVWLTPDEFAAIGAPAKLVEAVRLASRIEQAG